MKPENLNINFAQGEAVKEIIIRETNHVNEPLPILEPEKVGITGTITAPFAFLQKRWNAPAGFTNENEPQIDHARTHIIVDRDNLKMTLVCNETDKRHAMTVTGRIELSRQFKAFGVNMDVHFGPEDLANFFRINRSYFKDRGENMNLVSQLKSFRAKIETEVEREKKDNGSVTDVYKKVVNSNLPDSFKVCIPIYKGAAPEEIEIEVIATVNGRDVALELISPDAASIVEEVRDRLIDEQIGFIKELAPEIPIIEV
jgi:hypothetical protein